MGGVAADLDGASTVPGLYVVGETACTGLHGANRLASNSLTECFVLGKRAALAGMDEPRYTDAGAPPKAVKLTAPSDSTRKALWDDAGIFRTPEGLKRLLDDPHPIARLIGASALAREESRGAHFRTDFPELKPQLDGHHAVIRDGAGPPTPEFEHWL
jgi:L-aspartate oxidase